VWQYNSIPELSHSGVMGMKWGRRNGSSGSSSSSSTKKEANKNLLRSAKVDLRLARERKIISKTHGPSLISVSKAHKMANDKRRVTRDKDVADYNQKKVEYKQLKKELGSKDVSNKIKNDKKFILDKRQLGLATVGAISGAIVARTLISFTDAELSGTAKYVGTLLGANIGAALMVDGKKSSSNTAK